MNFYWQGEPIPDIEAWAKERGEEMVTVNFHHKEPSPFGPLYMEWDEVVRMPQLFYENLRITAGTGFPSIINAQGAGK